MEALLVQGIAFSVDIFKVFWILKDPENNLLKMKQNRKTEEEDVNCNNF